MISMKEFEEQMKMQRGYAAWRRLYWCVLLCLAITGLLLGWDRSTVLILAVLAVAVRP